MKELRELRKRGKHNFPFQVYRYNTPGRRIETVYHWHPEMEIHRVIEGNLDITIDDKLYVAKPGDIVFVSPEMLHSIYSRSGHVIYDAMVFSFDLLKFSLENAYEKEVIMPIEQHDSQVRLIVDDSMEGYDKILELVNEVFDRSENEEETVLSLINVMHYAKKYFYEPREEAYNRFNNKLVNKATQFMEREFRRKITLTEISSLCGMSEKYFCSYFKKYTGKTPVEYIINVRVDEAKKILLSTDRTVLDVSLECGFENIGYFSETFKKITGFSPSEFRKFNEE